MHTLPWKFSWINTGCRSDQISHSAVSDSLQPHESQHARPPCPSPTPEVHWDSRPSSQWCHPAISSSVVPFSSCPQSLPASESFPMSQLFTWDGQSTGVSALALQSCLTLWDPVAWRTPGFPVRHQLQGSSWRRVNAGAMWNLHSPRMCSEGTFFFVVVTVLLLLFRCMDIASLIYALTFWWTFGLFTVWGYHKAAANICVSVCVYPYTFISLG